jgi:hypothetical protein
LARIRKEQALAYLKTRLKELEPGEALDFLCKKRNRIVRIVKEKEGFSVKEKGFFEKEFSLKTLEEVIKLAERLFEREFPRSYMLWVHRRKA